MKILYPVIAGIVGFFIGICIVRVPYLSLDPQINIVDVANLLAVIVLAFMIPVILSVRLDSKKAHKELLIIEVSTLCENLLSINNLIATMAGKTPSRDEFNQVLNLFKRARNQMSQIDIEVAALNDKASLQKCQKLSDDLSFYWSSVTGNDGIKTANFIVSPAFIWKQVAKYENVIKVARALKFEINRVL